MLQIAVQYIAYYYRLHALTYMALIIAQHDCSLQLVCQHRILLIAEHVLSLGQAKTAEHREGPHSEWRKK